MIKTNLQGSESEGGELSSMKSENFIDVPSLNARIMHPNKNLSLEEIRMRLSKYKIIMEKLEQTSITNKKDTPN